MRSPTSRSSRAASAHDRRAGRGDVRPGDDAVGQRLGEPAHGGQRRAQLVRHRQQELPLPGLAAGQRVGEVVDRARDLRHLGGPLHRHPDVATAAAAAGAPRRPCGAAAGPAACRRPARRRAPPRRPRAARSRGCAGSGRCPAGRCPTGGPARTPRSAPGGPRRRTCGPPTSTLADTGTPGQRPLGVRLGRARCATGPVPGARPGASSTMSTPWACSVWTSLRDAAACRAGPGLPTSAGSASWAATMSASWASTACVVCRAVSETSRSATTAATATATSATARQLAATRQASDRRIRAGPPRSRRRARCGSGSPRRAWRAAGRRARRRCGCPPTPVYPHTADSSCSRVNTRPGARMRWVSRSNSVEVSATSAPAGVGPAAVDLDAHLTDRQHLLPLGDAPGRGAAPSAPAPRARAG